MESIDHCWLPAEASVELLVVDNGSIDHTREIVEAVELDGMPVRYVLEPRTGKGNAYNTGMASAQGDIFLFTDDDVRVPKNWIVEMCDAIMCGEADAVAGGVRIAPHLQRPWLNHSYLRSWLASTELIAPDDVDRMVGANMAFSRRVLEKVEGFDVALGPGALGFGDETLFSHQLLQAGYRLTSKLDVEVEHHFDASRLTRTGMLQIAVRAGRSQAYWSYHWKHEEWPRPFRRLVKAALRLGLWRFTHLYVLWRKPGITLEEWRQVHYIAFLRAYLRNTRQRRNYERCGLQKIVS